MVCALALLSFSLSLELLSFRTACSSSSVTQASAWPPASISFDLSHSPQHPRSSPVIVWALTTDPVCGLSLLTRILCPRGQGLALPFSVAPLRVLGTYYVFIGPMEMHRGFWGRLGVWFNLSYSWNFRFPRYKRIAWVLPNYGSQWPKISMAKFKWAGLKFQKNMTV